MNQEKEVNEFTPSLPLLARLDRLELLLQCLEERRNLSAKKLPYATESKTEAEEDQCKTISSALEEVNHKGNLLERVEMLENRVLHIFRLIMDVQHISRSSSSTIEQPENCALDDQMKTIIAQGGNKEGNYGGDKPSESKGKREKKIGRKIRCKKWLGKIRFGCS